MIVSTGIAEGRIPPSRLDRVHTAEQEVRVEKVLLSATRWRSCSRADLETTGPG